ncbi:hypothetical protein JCM33374_g6452 [Metschnikowia sp. JCM 33374]|nr:hypothetical protein JCM33374_g6452 [Metschnikowia sp. JCM 33374]
MKLTTIFPASAILCAFVASTPTGRSPATTQLNVESQARSRENTNALLDGTVARLQELDFLQEEECGCGGSPDCDPADPPANIPTDIPAAASCSFENVRFVLPSMRTVKCPITIAFEVGKLSCSMAEKDADLLKCNMDLKQLLLDRMVWLDSLSDPETLAGADRYLKLAYGELVRASGDTSRVSHQRKLALDAVFHKLMDLRLPLLEILYGKALYPKADDLVAFKSFLSTEVVALNLPACSQVPEEKMLIDLLRALRVISRCVVAVIRKERKGARGGGQIGT